MNLEPASARFGLYAFQGFIVYEARVPTWGKANEGLRLACLIGNPTGTAIHNKMVLVRAGDRGWVNTGSINGSENSNKLNREMAVQVESRPAFEGLSQVFWSDWLVSGGAAPAPQHCSYMPVVMK